MFLRKSIATAAGGLVMAIALVAGCSSAPLTNAHQIMNKTVESMKTVKSLHFELTAIGEFVFGFDTSTPEPSASGSGSAAASESASASASASAPASASASASASGSAASSGSPAPSASLAASASVATTATPAPTASPTATPYASPTPTPGPASISLNDTTASGDIDLANTAAHIQGTLPGLPDFAGEVIVVKGYAYVRTPGQDKYVLEADTSLALNPADATGGPAAMVQTIIQIAADPSLSPQLLGTDPEPGGACYHIRVQATPDLVKAKMGLVGTGVGTSTLDLWIFQDSFRVERLELHTSDPTTSAAIRLVMSNYDNIAPINPPPAEQFEIPGLESPTA